MVEIPYSQFSKEQLILRDFLAIDRTILANESTFLAYLRTALSLFVAGVSLMKFFDTFWIQFIGAIFVPSAILTFIIAFYRFRKMNGAITSIKRVKHQDSKEVEISKEIRDQHI